MNRTKKRLTLQPETLRTLSSYELRSVMAGYINDQSEVCGGGTVPCPISAFPPCNTAGNATCWDGACGGTFAREGCSGSPGICPHSGANC